MTDKKNPEKNDFQISVKFFFAISALLQKYVFNVVRKSNNSNKKFSHIEEKKKERTTTCTFSVRCERVLQRCTYVP